MDASGSSQTIWRVQMFAGLRAVSRYGVFERFPTQMTGSLFARLALAPGTPHSREELIEKFWPEADPASGRNRLNLAVSWLRGQLEPQPDVARGSVLDAERRTIRLLAETVASDAAEFDAACAEASRLTDPHERLAALHRAIPLYTGELLPGFYDDWALQERERLLAAFISMLTDAAKLHKQHGEHGESIALLERALAADPISEETQEELIRAFVSADRASAALRQFQALERLLEREYGTTPSPEIIALVEQIRARATAPQKTPAPREPMVGGTLVLPPLPRTLTRFFGRQEERTQVRELLVGAHTAEAELSSETRLVTLVGPGGSGKTRLALEVAHEIQRAGFLPAAFVTLSDVSDPAAVPAHVADALRLPRTAGADSLERIETALTARPLLLLLDNAEHLLEGVASLAHTLLERLPDLSILVTSRQRLGISGEHEVPILPLAILPSGALITSETLAVLPSVQLFVDRARSVRPSFALTEQNAEVVASLCRDLEGLPLAIELCASWASMLTPAQMRDKLERRFDLLVSHRSDISPRHRTLRAAMEYSFVLLPDSLRPVFRALSVFRGGCTLEAAEAVCPEIPTHGGGDLKGPSFSALNALAELSARSLVFAEIEGDGADSDVMRYRMLDTVREFAAEQFVYREAQERRRAHAAYFLYLAERAEPLLFGPEQENWLTRLDRDLENLRAALEWDRESGDIESGLRLAGALHQYWYVRGYLKEGCDLLASLLAAAEKSPEKAEALPDAVAAKAWAALGHLRWCQGEYAEARTAHERALILNRRRGDAVGIARSLNYLGITFFRLQDLDEAERLLTECRTVATDSGDRAGVGRALANLGNVAMSRGRYGEADDLFEKSLSVFRELGDIQRMADMMNNLGMNALFRKDYARATYLLEETLRIRGELRDRFGESIALGYLGAVQRREGKGRVAETTLTGGIRLAYEVGNRYTIAHYLAELGLLAQDREQWERCVFLISASFQLNEKIGAGLVAFTPEEHDKALAAAKARLTPETYRDAGERGRSLPLAQVVGLVGKVE